MLDSTSPSALLEARVLVVDDQPPNVLLLRKMLQAAGYVNVAGTTDPTEVRDLHQREPFDIILLDIRMPKLDGFGVMQQPKGLQRDDDYVAILVLTAQADAETRLSALEAVLAFVLPLVLPTGVLLLVQGEGLPLAPG